MTPDGSIRTHRHIQIVCKGGRAGASEMRVTVTAHLLGFGILYSDTISFLILIIITTTAAAAAAVVAIATMKQRPIRYRYNRGLNSYMYN